jgi:hypothetical protein
MLWIDYSIDQVGDSFKIVGDTPTEVMDKGLYKPGDMFVVNEHGWLVKVVPDTMPATLSIWRRD